MLDKLRVWMILQLLGGSARKWVLTIIGRLAYGGHFGAPQPVPTNNQILALLFMRYVESDLE